VAVAIGIGGGSNEARLGVRIVVLRGGLLLGLGRAFFARRIGSFGGG